MNIIKIVFLFLLCSFSVPILSQTKKPVKKTVSTKTVSKPIPKTPSKEIPKTASKPKTSKPVSKNQKTNPVEAKQPIAKEIKKEQKKTTGKEVAKTAVNPKVRSNCVKYTISKKVKTVLQEAKTYEGVVYKLGGNTKKGIDCSALVKNSFKKVNIELPRRAIEMSGKGKRMKINQIKEGDLLFFATSKGKINHVAIVYKIKQDGIISFIHASSSRGVMISDLDGSYWPGRFVKANRIT